MDKKNRRMIHPRSLPSVILTVVALSVLIVSCAPGPGPDLARGASLTLTTFSKNSVTVVVKLQRAADGQVSLAATFTPDETGFHLYSKDMPRNGVGGLGRPTLLELTTNSKMQVLGTLIESVGA